MFWSTRKTTDLEFQYDNVVIHPTAEIGQDVEIGPFTFIGPNCRIGDECRIHNNVSIVENTVLGGQNEVFPGAVLGAVPQDKKYGGEDCWVIIGNSNAIRENVTIHGGTELGGKITRIGHRNLLMAGCHVAHDCILEDEIILANNVLLGGHVHVEQGANLGGGSAVHHFATIGRYAFVAGTSRVNRDVPPYLLWQENRPRTINKIGLKRQECSEETLEALKQAFKRLYRGSSSRLDALEWIETNLGQHEEIRALLSFLKRTASGRQGRARQPYHVTL